MEGGGRKKAELNEENQQGNKNAKGHSGESKIMLNVQNY